MSDPSENELIARCTRGDSAAWDALFDRHYAPTWRFVFQMSPDFTHEDAEEICQEVFITVVRSLNTFAGKSQLQTWIFKIAANKARDYRDKQVAQKRGGGIAPLSLNATNEETGLTLDPPSARPGPDGELMATETTHLVRAALDQLGHDCREVIELRYFGDLSYEEIASSLALNPKTVSSRLSKCLDRMEEVVTTLLARENNSRFAV